MFRFGRSGLLAKSGGEVIPLVDEDHPERNGFYRVTEAGLERVEGWTLRDQIDGYRFRQN